MSHAFFDPYPVRWAGCPVGGTLFVISESLSLLLIRYEDFVESATTGTFVAQQMLLLLARCCSWSG